MPDNPFCALECELLEAGISPRQVRRIVMELEDHVEDLREEALAGGMSFNEATDFARRRIGHQAHIAERVLSTPELRPWIYRYPRFARLYLPLAYVLLLPAAPVFANPGRVFRWSAALMLSAAVTATMMLCMQLAIALS